MDKVGAGSTIFVLFFGLGLIKAFQDGQWPEAAVLAALGILSFWMDLGRR